MGVPPSEAKRLTLWEFGALRDGWNELHKGDDDDGPAEPPTEEYVRSAQAELVELGIAGGEPN